VAGAGALVVVGTPIGNLGDLTPRACAALADADVVACEDTRRTRRLLSAVGLPAPPLIAVHEHNEASAGAQILERVRAGQRVALVSDAGMPGISDPGERVVRAVAAAGLTVEVVPGPTAAITALVASGLPADRWCFDGFLPRKGAERRRRLTALAAESRTTVLYEAPHRLVETLADLVESCGPSRAVAVCRELTKVHEQTWRGRLGDAVDAVGEPRGEYVIVIDGAPPAPPASDEDIGTALAAELATGAGRKVAVASVAADLGVPRRRVYDLALRLRPRSQGE
jgi:16S rRNA (cytidine1402-2'-O)-methyltransferase